ncbi:tautomerase family protein [Aspergillus melleus]|uniref:tautomerase family protein n=1 Tax=Aspergillus melleus TaxID=138277 RepID=UPI001E8D9ED9|nr:uncharacterized protein LDX57_012086 [Aspergillus melleus]KAH8434439.1 hypothetical protein LDX57_012086 [Aspergillus melleus]
MPLWQIHHGSQTLSDEDKKALAKQITEVYVNYGLPAFYVRVEYQEMSPTTSFTGGEHNPKFVGLTVYHLARQMTSDSQVQRFLSDVDTVLTPLFEPKGIDWEYFVTEAPSNLWKINGLVPPPAGSEGEKQWRRLNRPVKL